MSFSYVPETPYVVMQFVMRFLLRCKDFFVTWYLVVQQETRKYDHLSLPLELLLTTYLCILADGDKIGFFLCDGVFT